MKIRSLIGAVALGALAAQGCDFHAAYDHYCEKSGSCGADASSAAGTDARVLPDAAQAGPDAGGHADGSGPPPGPDASEPEPGLDAAAPGLDAGGHADGSGPPPGRDASEPEPGLDAAAPGLDAAVPGLDAGGPRLDAAVPGLDAAAPGPDAGGSPVCAYDAGPGSPWAAWPVPPEAPTDYAPSAETVTDHVTGLVWERFPPAKSYDWSQAKTYCAGLSLEVTCGWRLPTRIELLSIVDSTRTSPSINPTDFPGTVSDAYWTASTNQNGQPYLVWFDDGYTDTGASTTLAYVRCVR